MFPLLLFTFDPRAMITTSTRFHWVGCLCTIALSCEWPQRKELSGSKAMVIPVTALPRRKKLPARRCRPNLNI